MSDNSHLYHTIDEKTARLANTMNSMFDYEEGSATAGYQSMVDVAVALVSSKKLTVDPIHHDRLDKLLDLYCRRLADNRNNFYRIQASVPSVLISGPANFPVRKKEQQNRSSLANAKEFSRIQDILNQIKGVGNAGISSDDPEALSKLNLRITELKEDHIRMKAVNAYYRKHNTLDGCPDLDPDIKAKIIESMAYMSNYNSSAKAVPYSGYALSGNKAEIARLEARVKDLQKRLGETTSKTEFPGGVIVENAEANRLQIIFDNVPSEEIRSELKRNGFRWAPSQKAWQRQLTNNARYSLQLLSFLDN